MCWSLEKQAFVRHGELTGEKEEEIEKYKHTLTGGSDMDTTIRALQSGTKSKSQLQLQRWIVAVLNANVHPPPPPPTTCKRQVQKKINNKKISALLL